MVVPMLQRNAGGGGVKRVSLASIVAGILTAWTAWSADLPLGEQNNQFSDEETNGPYRDQALAVIKQHQLNPDLPCPRYREFKEYINLRWPHHPKVIAFYREALTTRPAGTIEDLWSPTPGVWDDSFFDLIVKFIENEARHNTGPPYTTLRRAMDILPRHARCWAADGSANLRLSKALLVAFPSLTQPPANPKTVKWSDWYIMAEMLVMTGDKAMIEVFRPYLKIKHSLGNGLVSMKETPYRVCDIAHRHIVALLGEQDLREMMIWQSVLLPPRNLEESAAEVKQWDRKVEELEKRLGKSKPSRQ